MSGQTGGKEPQGSSGGRSLETASASAVKPDSAVRYVRSADLFGGAREVVIEHEHHRYRLKMTSRGGLILNK